MQLKEKFNRNSDDAIKRNRDQLPFTNNKLAIMLTFIIYDINDNDIAINIMTFNLKMKCDDESSLS